MSLLPLIGILIVVVGFALRMNALVVVVAAGLATGLAAHQTPVEVVAAFGKAFVDSRAVSIVWLTLPVIGMLERAGLRERARTVVSRFGTATVGRLLLGYLVIRQLTAALGLTSIGGHAQMVRPLVAPMAEAAAESGPGSVPEARRRLIRAHAAAADNIGLFFGEDIFIAIGSILLIRGFLDQNGIHVTPASLALWAIPTAICALVIHGVRLFMLDRVLGASSRPRAEAVEPTGERA